MIKKTIDALLWAQLGAALLVAAIVIGRALI